VSAEATPLAALRTALAPEGRLAFLAEPGPWLWTLLAIGAALRAFLVLATEGTHDVAIWQSHAGWTRQYGLVGYYERSEVFNHPPFVGWLMARLWAFAVVADLPFGVVLRAPFAVLDLGSALLLLRLFSSSRARYLVFAGYWLNPVAILFSAYHGNTDSAVAFSALLAVLAASRSGTVAAGVALGVGLWIKLPVSLAAPAIFFFLSGWKRRLVFTGAALGVGLSTYLPVLVTAPELLAERVFFYAGRVITTPGGTPIWGIWNVLGILDALPPALRSFLQSWRDAHLVHNRLLAWLFVVALAALRRNETTARGLGATVCGSFAIFHGLTQTWAFQYLAWMVPFWPFAGVGFSALATLTTTGYVYGVYAMLCGDPFLMGPWAFQAHADWPAVTLLLRDASVLVFFAAGWTFLGSAALGEWRRVRGRTPG
jgi:hypothetical protein